MLIGTILQIFVVPALFVIFQSLQERISPIKFEGESDDEVMTPELEQYAHDFTREYELKE